jgi:hypothetical protein
MLKFGYGCGGLDKDGYKLMPRGMWRGKRLLEHHHVWQEANGPIPEGKEIHHKNGDKQDNRLENLECVDRLTHRRIHCGAEQRADGWWKPCGKCKEFYHESHYASKGGRSSYCMSCWREYCRCASKKYYNKKHRCAS